jgi:acetoacetate decarboxylase
MSIPLEKIANMPAYSPYYPMPPARYRNVRFQYVYFRADVSAIDRVLPACFEASQDGFCAAIGLTAPWTANYGKFEESVLVVKCTYGGEVGYFAPVVFLNSRSSIPAGREIYGTPKVYADMEVGMDERVMYTDTRLAGVSVLSIRSTMQRAATMEELPALVPSWRLKVIPRADGVGADVMQLIDGARSTSDVNVHVCRAGEGVVQFNPSPIYDLSDFAPQEYYGAHYVEMDYTEGYAEIVHDFLRPT